MLATGAILTALGVRTQRSLPLRAPLAAAVPGVLEGRQGRDLTLSEAERRAAGVDAYLVRVFEDPDTTVGALQVYVGYYQQQTQGKSIHSPKNCLPGSGWEALVSRTAIVSTPSGQVTVNRYLLQKGPQRALVLYWYQGRGRVAWNEYAVKWNLLRDAALRRRTEEALVRVVVPVRQSEADAFSVAARVAAELVGSLRAALPG